MSIFEKVAVAGIASGLIAACSPDQAAIDPETYEADIMQWRAERLQRLKGRNGYLNLVGLYWLPQGSSTLGSAADNDIVLPDGATPRVAELQLTETGVLLVVAADADVRYDDIPVRSILMSDDTTEHPVVITHRSFAWSVIKREGRYALRVRDYDHPAIADFPPIEYYPIDQTLRVSASLKRFAAPKILNVDTVIEGLGWQPESPGTVVFEIDGEPQELEAYASGDELFFIFGDQTSGSETYPAGRFLYADFPEDGRATILDFNRAYNPPCAFNDFATCPVAAPQNRLAVRIEAGEKFDPKVHAVPRTSY